MLKLLFLAFFSSCIHCAQAQPEDALNTARNCSYMKPEEREMIYEINRVRSNPLSYLPYIEPLLAEAAQRLKLNGKGPRNYSLTFTSTTTNGKEEKTVDTVWHHQYEEEVKALTSLIADLKKLKPLSVLLPDSGIYKAASKHANDQNKHSWTLMHTGTDGSHPWDRITRFSPRMSFGNENIAGRSGNTTTVRDIMIQLLVDDGIPGYGHRYNLLDPQWTHVACRWVFYKEYMNWWIQNFGVEKK